MQCGYDNNLHRAWIITRKLPWSHGAWCVGGDMCVGVWNSRSNENTQNWNHIALIDIWLQEKKCNEGILFCSDVLSRFPSFINYINFYEFNFLQILICTYRPTHVFMCRYTYMCLCMWKPEDSSGCHPQKYYPPALKHHDHWSEGHWLLDWQVNEHQGSSCLCSQSWDYWHM